MENYFLFAIISWLIFAVLASDIAAKRGHSGFMTFLMCIVFTPLAGLIYAIARPVNQDILEAQAIKDGDAKRCQYCREVIKVKATICKHCHSQQPELDSK